jgi:hypothetical protein
MLLPPYRIRSAARKPSAAIHLTKASVKPLPEGRGNVVSPTFIDI